METKDRRFDNIDDCLNWVMSQKSYKGDIFNFRKCMAELGNKQDRLKVIHVAGTDGKGSTVHFIMDALMALGYKVGTLQSPHLLTHLDRIRINDQYIDEKYFLDKVNENYDYFIEHRFSMFDIDYFIMTDYFLDNNVDYAVIEVGLGGRLDSTNVINNTLLSIITTIGYDHMDRLGNTLEEIVREKCGIIKQDSHTLIGKLAPNLVDIVRDTCKSLNNTLYQVKDYEYIAKRHFRYRDQEYHISSFALYQMENASLAIEAIYTLASLEGFEIDFEKLKQGIASSMWLGRFEVINEDPLVIIDGAHNAHGMRALVDSLRQLPKPIVCVFSALKDKEYLKMLEMLKNEVEEITITTFENYRIYDVHSIPEDKMIKVEDDYLKAINDAIDTKKTVIICGSLYFISEVYAAKLKGLLHVS
ncbi:MAG: bifunctional folylpolyglutamate synthase/dihydrofolate synthase [Erysipelotrichaceae bacterium]|nr:bifunctional folylpolyglutamate synthase/dihydrofolate synthase [Erysipelotrichaceae bacterium]